MADRALELAAFCESLARGAAMGLTPGHAEDLRRFSDIAALLRSQAADADALAEALGRYGMHDGDCEAYNGNECTCGLSAALARHDGGARP